VLLFAKRLTQKGFLVNSAVYLEVIEFYRKIGVCYSRTISSHEPSRKSDSYRQGCRHWPSCCWQALEAPVKSSTWFENFAHDVFYDEPDKFSQEVIRIANETLAEAGELLRPAAYVEAGFSCSCSGRGLWPAGPPPSRVRECHTTKGALTLLNARQCTAAHHCQCIPVTSFRTGINDDVGLWAGPTWGSDAQPHR
jgi:hypothetical protein